MSNQPRHVNEILGDMMGDMFNQTPAERLQSSCAERDREMPKICAMLNMDPETLKPIEVEA